MILYRKSYNENKLTIAEQQIRNEFGDRVSVARKAKSLFKNARTDNASQDTEKIIAQGISNDLVYYLTSNGVDSLSSDDAIAAGTVKVEGHYDDGSDNRVFTVQEVDLDGQNAVTLSQPLCRITGIISTGSTVLDDSSNVYGYESNGTSLNSGVPTDKIHIVMEGRRGRSLKAATFISSNDYYIITSFGAEVTRSKQTGVRADIILKIRAFGGNLWTEFDQKTIGTGSDSGRSPVDPYFIVPKDHDVILTVKSSVNSTVVTGGFSGYLAKVI